jgi:hypothetical protein
MSTAIIAMERLMLDNWLKISKITVNKETSLDDIRIVRTNISAIKPFSSSMSNPWLQIIRRFERFIFQKALPSLNLNLGDSMPQKLAGFQFREVLHDDIDRFTKNPKNYSKSNFSTGTSNSLMWSDEANSLFQSFYETSITLLQPNEARPSPS